MGHHMDSVEELNCLSSGSFGQRVAKLRESLAHFVCYVMQPAYSVLACERKIDEELGKAARPDL
jgi:hypothetical protein